VLRRGISDGTSYSSEELWGAYSRCVNASSVLRSVRVSHPSLLPVLIPIARIRGTNCMYVWLWSGSLGQVWEETGLAAYDAREHPLRFHLAEEHDIRKHLPISRLLS
jgi:hypothetical protein